MTIVLAAAQEAGAANAVAPVIRQLQRRGDVQVVVASCAEAAGVFAQQRFGRQAIRGPRRFDRGGVTWTQELLHAVHPDVLLLGTALGPSVDKALLQLVEPLQTPSVSVIDRWCHYRERFMDPCRGALHLPTRIAVIDAVAFDQAVEAGLPKDVLVITGQPYLDELCVELHNPALAEQARVLRATWLGAAPPDSRRIVLFASEPFSSEGMLGTAYEQGYTEVDVLESLIEGIERCEAQSPLHAEVVVKLHPKESRQSMRWGPRAVQRGVRVVADMPPWPCILAADVVVGIDSMFLLEASCLGKPTISVQFGDRGRRRRVGFPDGFVPVVCSSQELAQCLEASWLSSAKELNQTLADGLKRLAGLAQGQAASRIARLVCEVLTPRPSRAMAQRA